METKEKILINLEETFTLRGFAEPGVAELKKAAGVSLRTLYRHFPSKIDMINGVLEYRHNRYKNFILDGIPPCGSDAVIHIFKKAGLWMNEFSSNGCLYLNALASYPDNEKIKNFVSFHKAEILQLLKIHSGTTGLETRLYILHEGLVSSWALIGKKACETALEVIADLYKPE